MSDLRDIHSWVANKFHFIHSFQFTLMYGAKCSNCRFVERRSVLHHKLTEADKTKKEDLYVMVYLSQYDHNKMCSV